jgi:transposase
VANARKIPAITGSESKNDRNDAEKLARFAAYDPKLLSPLEHRSEQRQVDLNLIHARATLVRARTMIVNALRGLVKSAGGRLPACSTESLPARAPAAIPPALTTVATPLVQQIALLNAQIEGMDKQVEKLAVKYPEIGLLRTARRGADRCRRLRAHPGPARCGQQPRGGRVSRPASQPEPVRRRGPAKTHLQDRRPLSAQLAGAVGAIHPRPFRS